MKTTEEISPREAVAAMLLEDAVNDSPLRHRSDRATRRILLADDDPGIRELLGRVLQSEGYAVQTVRTGLQAANHFAHFRPDLVLLDLTMPDLDGWGAFLMMTGREPLVPIIVITARADQREQATQLGVDALMEKPLDLPVLLDTIRHLLSETEAERTLRLVNRNFKPQFFNAPR